MLKVRKVMSTIFLLFWVFHPMYAEDYQSLHKKFLQKNRAAVREGHCCNEGVYQLEFFHDLLQKNPQIKCIGEIGFNAGHSCMVFLGARPDTVVYSFDIMHHKYVSVGKKFMDLTFPGRCFLIAGDSQVTIPSFAKDHPEIQFDLIFIDGGHTTEVAYNDIKNMYELAHENTLVIVDDLQFLSVKNAVEQHLQECLLIEKEIIIKPKRTWGLYTYNKTAKKLNSL